ncbi:MAG TPA: Rieske (2Fe-2S) protein [Ktedonobacterales bacterium]|nr:Rieske (2Fe-2S) protein [Ktedonobacterales bacterium]
MGTDNHWGDIDMSDVGKENEAERLEEYLEFERHLERLQQEKRPRRTRRMTPGQAKAYQMAALFRAAAPGNAEPDPAFAARLEAQLEGKLKGRSRWFRSLLPAPRSGGVSRRSVLAGGLSAAAGLAAGAVLGGVVEQQLSVSQQSKWSIPLIGLGRDWQAIGTAAEIAPGQMVQFRTATVVGYVFHNDEINDRDDGQPEPEWIAMSAACTHMGCIVAWNSQDRLLHCPCHAGAFTRYGAPAGGSQSYLRSLPRMQVQVRDGQVWVQVPTALPDTSSDESQWGDE